MIVYDIYLLILLEGYMRIYFKRNIFIENIPLGYLKPPSGVDPFKNLFVIIIISIRLFYLDLLK